jgi:hypothetical protein
MNRAPTSQIGKLGAKFRFAEQPDLKRVSPVIDASISEQCPYDVKELLSVSDSATSASYR